MTHSLDGFVQFLHTVHHGGIAVRVPVTVCALVSIWVVLKMIEYTFCGS
jgi:hypothetical protein